MPDITKIIEGLQGALDVAQKLAPAAQALGLPAEVIAIANVAKAAVDVAENVLDRINDGKIVAAAGDTATVRAIITDLQAENDKLNDLIADS